MDFLIVEVFEVVRIEEGTETRAVFFSCSNNVCVPLPIANEDAAATVWGVLNLPLELTSILWPAFAKIWEPLPLTLRSSWFISWFSETEGAEVLICLGNGFEIATTPRFTISFSPEN